MFFHYCSSAWINNLSVNKTNKISQLRLEARLIVSILFLLIFSSLVILKLLSTLLLLQPSFECLPFILLSPNRSIFPEYSAICQHTGFFPLPCQNCSFDIVMFRECFPGQVIQSPLNYNREVYLPAGLELTFILFCHSRMLENICSCENLTTHSDHPGTLPFFHFVSRVLSEEHITAF